MPFFSILVPVYNVEKFLKYCLDSIVNQSFNDFEAILVDDGSIDSSGKICDEYAKIDSRFKVVHQDNIGLFLTRISGMKVATGQYIIFADSDDFLEINLLETMYSLIQKHCCDLIIYRYNLVDERNNKNGEVRDRFKNESKIDKKVFFEVLINSTDFNSMWIKCVRRSLCKTDVNYKNISMGEDILHTLPIIYKADNIIYCNKTLYNYRSNPSSITKKMRIDYILQSSIVRNEILKYIELLYAEHNNIKINLYNQYILGLAWYIMKNNSKELKTNDFRIIIEQIKEGRLYKLCLKNKKKLKLKSFCVLQLIDFRKYIVLHWICKFIYNLILRFKQVRCYIKK